MPVQLVAEVGTTCNGKLADALKLADTVKASGADAIKYMLIGADHFMADKTVEYTYKWAGGTKSVNMYEMFKGLEFTPEEWENITGHCQEIGLPWFLTVDYVDGMPLAESLGCSQYKLSAWDIRNFPLIRAMAETNKAIWIDLGPSLLGEIITVHEEIKKICTPHTVLLHSTHSQEEADANLASIPFLKQQFPKSCVGWSSPGAGFGLDAYAMMIGAHVIEKRITLDRDADGHHNLLALNPDDFKNWVNYMREVESIRGVLDVRPSLTDLRDKDKYFTSIVAARDIPQGARIEEKDLAAKRPGMGISPLYLDRFYGKPTTRMIPKNAYVRWEDV